MPSISWEFSVWNVAVYLLGAAVLLWRSFTAVDKRVSVFEQILSSHAQTLLQHAARMDVHDERLISVIEQLQRVIGQSEGQRR
jgi:hypothetical protein